MDASFIFFLNFTWNNEDVIYGSLTVKVDCLNFIVCEETNNRHMNVVSFMTDDLSL